MKDTTGHNQSNGEERTGKDASQDRFMSSYTPEQRRVIRQGLRILARVAVRAHMRRQAARDRADDAPDEADPGDDGDADGSGNECEGRGGV